MVPRCSAALPCLRYLRAFCTVTAAEAGVGEHDPGRDTREHLQKQILQAGLQFLRGDVEKLRQNVARRGATADVDKLVRLHQENRQLIHQTNELRHQRNSASKEFTSAKTKEEKDQLMHKGAELKHTIKELETQRYVKEAELIAELSLVPNDTHPDVVTGGYENVKVVYVHGNKPEFTFPVKEHVEIGEELGILDFRSAAQVTGNSFYYLTKEAAVLELALIQYAMQKAIAKGYCPVITPDVIKTEVVEGCGFHPRGPAAQVYTVSAHHGHQPQHCLSGTAEIPLAGMFMDRLIPRNQLPMRLVAFGRCYRAEAGGKGHATRGLYRVHQFSKVELFGLVANEEGTESDQMLEEIVELQREIIGGLGLHYRVLDMPTEELGTPVYRKFDIEAWMPGRGDYGEVTSASNCTDFQSRRLRITYPNPARRTSSDPKRRYAHTVNGTACAIPRMIVALLENHQQEDGSVLLPEALCPHIGQHSRHIRLC